jgi:CelD/BcsL family acetyltransferase involved in cellulose biosynthesis
VPHTDPALPAVVEVVADPERFAALRDEWNALLRASTADGVFLTWEWLHTWWRHLAGARRLRLAVARRGGRLLAVAPWADAGGPLWRLAGVPRLEFLGTGMVGSDYLDVILRGGDEAAALAVLATHLLDTRPVLRLGQLVGGTSRAATLGTTLAGHGWAASEVDSDVCPFIRLAGHSWESYLATLGPEHRYNFRRRLRKLQASGFRFETVATEERRRAVLRVLFDLHQRRWRTRGGSQAFGSSAVFAFHDDFSRLALERGWLRLFALWVDGEPAAAVYAFRYGPKVSFYQSGFDPRFAPRSVGLVALGLAIRTAVEEGAREFDLLHGDEAYKFQWAGETRRLARLELFPPRPAAVVCRRLVTTSRAARRTARRLLPEGVVRWIGSLRRPGSLHAPETASAR